MGRDYTRSAYGRVEYVSIHAPAWGATASFDYAEALCDVSIHAPAWGATGDPSFSTTVEAFQSTRPHGARHDILRSMVADIRFQSTRPHGARLGLPYQAEKSTRFNPRARMGRD